MRSTTTRAAGAALALATLAAAGCANRDAAVEDAADYPSGNITLVVPYDAGGASDLSARALAEQMEEELDQSIVVENRTGAAGSVGLEYLADQDPDGYTIGYLPVEVAMLGHQGYDVDPDRYEPIGQMVSVPATIAVPADSPHDTLDDLLAAAEDSPGQVSVANSGPGSIWESATFALGDAAGVEFQPVPFDGGAPAVTAAIGDQVDAVVAGISETAPAHADGELRVLAVLDSEPSEALDGVETAIDQGVDVVIGGWGGIGAPTGLDEEVRQALENAFTSAAASEEFIEVIDNSGNIAVNVPSAEFTVFVLEEYDRFAGLLADADDTADAEDAAVDADADADDETEDADDDADSTDDDGNDADEDTED